MALSISAVMFAYNEGEHLAAVVGESLDELAAYTDNYQLVVVDDGSIDGSGEILASLAAENDGLTLISHAANRGIGEAVHSGYAAANREYICILPADGQVRIAEYVALFEAAESESADLVLARYRQRGQVDGLFRVVLSRGLRLMMWSLLGVRRHIDPAFVFRRRLLDELPLTSRTFFVNLELPVRIIRSGAHVIEVPMTVFPRISGQSKVVQTRRIARVASDLLQLRVQLWRERSRGGRA